MSTLTERTTKQLHDEARKTGDWTFYDGFILGISMPFMEEEELKELLTESDFIDAPQVHLKEKE